jgi:trk system potassium uptake protein TrkH
MGYREISKILGYFLLAFSAVLLIPLGLASYYQFLADPISHPQPHSVLSFFATFLISLGSSLIFLAMGRSAEKTLYRREGIAIVVLIWFLTPAFAALPFIFSGTLSNPAQAYYEAASGLSTTGATMLCAKEYDLISRLEIPNRKSYQGI